MKIRLWREGALLWYWETDLSAFTAGYAWTRGGAIRAARRSIARRRRRRESAETIEVGE